MGDTDYALGRTNDEYERSIEQAEVLRPLTERPLRAVGVDLDANALRFADERRAARAVTNVEFRVGVRWKDLRHTFATRLREQGEDLKTIAELLGHTSTRMTDRYAHARASHLHATVQGLSRVSVVDENGDKSATEVATRKRGAEATVASARQLA